MYLRGLRSLISTLGTIIRVEVKVLHNVLLPKVRHPEGPLEVLHIARLPTRAPRLFKF
jgi:hypothetical protein